MANTTTLGSRAKALVGIAVAALVALLAAAMLAVSGCAPKAVSEQTQEDDPLLTQAVDWSMESDCSVCHAIENDMMQDANCPQASLHADLDCVQCHTNVEALTGAHQNLTYADASTTGDIKPKAETVDAQTCQDPACHGTMEDMAAKTADNTDFKDEKGKVQNPHEFPSNEQHDANQPTCTDCHKIHSEDLQEDAMDWCAQCHHKGVFQCGTCHELRQRA